jgi:deoxyribonuclease-2
MPSSIKVSALDESGKATDWWFIYKVPQLGAGAGNDGATGYEYVYYDATIDGKKDVRDRNIEKSPYLLNGGKGALNLTLDSVFKYLKNPPGTTGWILYNDEMPEDVKRKDDGGKGHTKGVIAFDTATKTAFWLLHSWPKYADPGASNDPTPKYGQTYLCLSLTLDTARAIAQQMITHQEPQIYDARVANLPKDDPLYKLSQAPTAKPTGDANVNKLKTAGGEEFWVLAKNKEWNKDFWNGFVGPTLGDDMDDETWIRGPIPPVADTDGIHKTFDIKYINLGFMGVHWAWPETHDHAKWGITLHNPWVCVGDINRMISQRKRGGGTIAFKNQILWQGLSRAGLILAPPGHSRTEAIELLQTSQHPHSEAPLKKKKPVTHAKLSQTRYGKSY